MRVVHEQLNGNIKSTIFKWENKFQLRIEMGSMSQEFKIPFERVSGGVDQVKELLTPVFFEACVEQFKQMTSSFISAYKLTEEK
jgi:hypothetical protein